MHTRIATVTFSTFLGLCGPGFAAAQASPQTATTSDDSDDLKISVYPILLWVPAFRATTNVPPYPDSPAGPDLPGGTGSTASSFDGAALAGFSIERGRWRVDADGIWAALVTERERPLLRVDMDLIYGHVSGGAKIYKDLYVTAGLRRVALKYDISLADRPQHFIRKPGVWDPLVGLALHSELGSHWVLHAGVDGGGFGVGSDVDLSGIVRADLKIVRHFGLTFGYNVLYLKLSDTVLDRTFDVKQTLHGPVLGLGLYF
jgi:hypothetical protein